ncbi:MAG: DEAD/DEAH box helicase [Anaerolineae bacterium]
MSLAALLTLWRDTPSLADNIAAWRTFPAKAAQLVPFPADLHPSLLTALQTRGIEALYSHQAAAWHMVQAGQNPVIVTGTASGKTLCYNLPILDRLLRDPAARALYLFPTKALAHDQTEALRDLISIEKSVVNPQGAFGSSQKKEIRNKKLERDASQLPSANLLSLISTYDADTPTSARSAIREKGRLVITNPDMLHTGILPHHPRWAEFFSHLQFVVIDEMHSYRGVFGSHVANVLRRLKRVAQFYGATPQFILTSATIANPVSLAEGLIEAPVVLVDNDGAVRGVKHFLIYNPPVVNPDLGLRRSAYSRSHPLDPSARP